MAEAERQPKPDTQSRPPRKKQKPFRNIRPASLLSFLFHATYDETLNEWFHDAPDEVLRDFDLTGQEADVIRKMGDAHLSPDPQEKQKIVHTLMSFLEEEILKEHYREIW